MFPFLCECLCVCFCVSQWLCMCSVGVYFIPVSICAVYISEHVCVFLMLSLILYLQWLPALRFQEQPSAAAAPPAPVPVTTWL